MPLSNNPAIELTGVTQNFESRKSIRPAISELDLKVVQGEFVALVGPSGCGKSTILNLIAGFYQPSIGEVLVDGARVDSPGVDRGLVFQQQHLFPWMSVRENVEYGPKMAGLDSVEVARIAEQQLALVGLSEVADQSPYELSGGMQQRAGIARALAAKPKVLLMDEPFSALDALTREMLQDELISIWRKTGITVVFVTHSIDEAVYMASRVILLSKSPGRIIHDVKVNFSQAEDYLHSRKLASFGKLRDELTTELKANAFA